MPVFAAFGDKPRGAAIPKPPRFLRISGKFINALLGMWAAILAEAVNFCFAMVLKLRRPRIAMRGE